MSRTQLISVNLPEALLAWLNEQAQRRRMNVSALIRELVERELDRLEDEA